jgi:hypothetical protein
MTEDQYENRSQLAVVNAWAEYEGRERDVQNGEYYETRVYFVDDDLVVAITDSYKREFVTCFHEHFRPWSHASRLAMPPVGQRRLEYKEWLENQARGNGIIGLQRHYGV